MMPNNVRSLFVTSAINKTSKHLKSVSFLYKWGEVSSTLIGRQLEPILGGNILYTTKCYAL